jgi:hypothetical protein
VIVDPGRSWLPPAGRCPAVQPWHGARETSSEKLRPREYVDAEETDRRWNKDDPPCKSGMAQVKLRQKGLDQEPGRTTNPETTERDRGNARNAPMA